MLIYAILFCVTSQQGYIFRAKYKSIQSFAITMYCPVYGCNSNSKKNSEKKIHFFAFPKATTKEDKKRCDIWIEFCKRKNFVPSKYTGLCSLHFCNDAYILAHSPDFLSSINFSGRRKLLLKPYAVPTINPALDAMKKDSEKKAKRQTGALARRKVSERQSIQYNIVRIN